MPLTPKQTKTLTRILKELNEYFKNFDKTLYTTTYNSKNFQEFLENTKNFTTDNILITDGIADKVSNAVITANNWNQLKQRELVQETIKQTCYDLVVGAGDDLKSELREMAKKAYDLGLGRKEIARALTERDLDALYIVRGEKTFTETEWNNLPESERVKYTFGSRIRVMSPQTRVKTIARTETKRAGTISNYIRAQERGKNKFKVSCRSDCCPLCARIYQDLQDYTPTETKETILNDGVEYDMIKDVDKLPPFHPNCRCSAEFYKGEGAEEEITNIPSVKKDNFEEELIKKRYTDVLDFYDFKMSGDSSDDHGSTLYHYTKKNNNGETTTLKIQDEVIFSKGYKKVSLSEIVNEIGKADLKDTAEITLLNYNDKYLDNTDLGVNVFNQPSSKRDPHHRIFFNPDAFNNKKYVNDNDITNHWKFVIHHEIIHSSDLTKNSNGVELSTTNDVQIMFMNAPEFTRYSTVNPQETFAEHGGYVKTMLLNPDLQDSTIKLANGKKINFEQYKEDFSEIYEYFKEL